MLKQILICAAGFMVAKAIVNLAPLPDSVKKIVS